MSIVASPVSHPSFSESELFTPSGSVSAHAEIPPPLDRPPLIPFPVFLHRHSSPYPSHQSFSALGPADLNRLPPSGLSVIAPPPAPKPPTMVLPMVLGDQDIQVELPPTPDPSPPNSKVLFPTTMVKLAPPADDQVVTEIQVDDIPRRLPVISIVTTHGEEMGVPGPGPSTIRERAHSGLPTSPSNRIETIPRPRSMGPGRPIRRTQTAVNPSAIRMEQSRSAESRARLRSSAANPRHASTHMPNPPILPRTQTDSVATPTRSLAPSITGNESDFGGPDGLEAKVVLLGSQGVGKTSLILRFTTRTFSATPAAATIGSSLHTRKLVHAGTRVKLQIWDTAGQERFRSMAPIYYRGAHVCVLVYDVADRASFDDVRSWLEELSRTVPKETVIFVVGSKVDLQAKRVVR
jgi:small GTP-binding protein